MYGNDSVTFCYRVKMFDEQLVFRRAQPLRQQGHRYKEKPSHKPGTWVVHPILHNPIRCMPCIPRPILILRLYYIASLKSPRAGAQHPIPRQEQCRSEEYENIQDAERMYCNQTRDSMFVGGVRVRPIDSVGHSWPLFRNTSRRKEE